MHVVSVLISTTLAHEPVMEEAFYPGIHGQCGIWVATVTSVWFPLVPIYRPPKREDGQLGGLCTYCPSQDSITILQICS